VKVTTIFPPLLVLDVTTCEPTVEDRLLTLAPVAGTVTVMVSAVIVPVAFRSTSSSNFVLLLLDSTPAPVPPADAAVTVSGSVTVLLSEPLVPVSVTLLLPVAAVADAASVSVLVVVAEAGLKLAVTPLGRPLADSATVPVKPPDGAIVTVALPLLPCLSDSEDGLADSAKLGAAVTVRLTVVVALSVPLVPVIVITLLRPAVAALVVVKVSTEEPVVEAGLNDAVTPAGTPLIESATLPVKPPVGVTVILDVPLAPCTTDRLAGLAASV
jgi:hypothetical protein